jgi:hypothetical protein
MLENERVEYIVAERRVQKLMREARRLSRQIDRRLRPPPPGWSHASFDPNVLLDAFPLLQLRDGFQLAAYQYYEGGNGNGFVFAIPARRWLPDPPEEGFSFAGDPSGSQVFSAPGSPLPEWAHEDVARFLEGDDSPQSYFQASIFIRELREMGAEWHGCSWSTHEVLTAAGQISKHSWKWQSEQLQSWLPVVRKNSHGFPEVVFFSHTGWKRERIVMHRDTFTEGYRFVSEEEIIALGEGGYVF